MIVQDCRILPSPWPWPRGREFCCLQKYYKFIRPQLSQYFTIFPSLLVTLFFGDPNRSNGTSRPT